MTLTVTITGNREQKTDKAASPISLISWVAFKTCCRNNACGVFNHIDIVFSRIVVNTTILYFKNLSYTLDIAADCRNIECL